MTKEDFVALLEAETAQHRANMLRLIQLMQDEIDGRDLTVLEYATQAHVAKQTRDGAMRQIMELTQRTAASPGVREQVWAMTDGHCHYCHQKMIRSEADMADASDRPRVFQIDHIVPRSLGGPDHIANFVPSCASCNAARKDEHYVLYTSRMQSKNAA